jgi:putative tryptophan/tyrosine transport system substrate-binding protein
MRRRNLIFGLLAVVAMGTAHAQQSGKVYRIAVVHPSHPVATLTETSFSPGIRAIFTELRRLGYVEGKNILIERYSGEGRAAHYPELARDVVRRNPDVIIAIGNDLVLDFKGATTTIPIVGTFGTPVEAGIVASLARPGGNVTGVSSNVGQLWPKRLQLFREMVPQAKRLGYLQTRRDREAWEAQGRPGDEVIWKMGVTAPVGPPLDPPVDEAAYRRAFVGLTQDHADGFMVSDEVENFSNQKVIVELADKNRLPAIYPLKAFVESGGLMSYGSKQSDHGRGLAVIADRILKGAKPADIPVFQPTKFELAINLKTAKALGLTVPPELLATADEVIE